MIDNNKLMLAEQFVNAIQEALEAEHDYFGKGSESLIAWHREKFESDLYKFNKYGCYYTYMPYKSHKAKPVWNEELLFPLADLYPEKCAELNGRLNPFQQHIDGYPQYKSAIKLFNRKKIFYPLSFKYVKKKLKPLNMQAIFDGVLASSILRWHEIQEVGIEYYISSNKSDAESIEKKSKALFKTIDASQDVIKNTIGSSFIKRLESLSHGFDGRYDYKRSNAKKLNEAHIKPGNRRFLSKIKHEKSDKEFFMRELVSNYRYYFGGYEYIHKPKYMKTNIDLGVPVDVIRCNFMALEGKNINNMCWHKRKENSAHSDVLADIATLIDALFVSDSFIKESERNIARYVKKQKEMDKKYNGQHYLNEYLTYYHGSMKYIIPCHDKDSSS